MQSYNNYPEKRAHLNPISFSFSSLYNAASSGNRFHPNTFIFFRQLSLVFDRNLGSLPLTFPSLPVTTELANHFQESLEKDSSSARTTGGNYSANNCDDPAIGVVRSLYEALRSHDVVTVHRLLAPDLEWWFHGPPSHQYLMRLLTGSQERHRQLSFAFAPDTITSLGKLVIAEGCNQHRSIFWVHAWSISDNGVITQVREYFNTSLTVTRFGSPEPSSEITPAASDALLSSVWESSLSDQVGKSVPGLFLAM